MTTFTKNPNQRIGIFGGSFNPIHNGHVNLARAVYKNLSLTKMLIIPTVKPPHKAASAIGFEDRAEMCRLAFENDKGFEISDIERHLGGNSYTINTIRAIRELCPSDAQLFLIIGADMLFSFRSWYRYESVLKEAKVVAAAREEDSYIDMVEFGNELGRVKVLNLPVTAVSSTEIREKLKKGEDVSELVPEKVLTYITEKGFYIND